MFHTTYACIFHPCNFDRIAFSTPAFSVAPYIPSMPLTMSCGGLLMFPGCWIRRENTHGFGGRPQMHIDSVSACQSACLSSSSCVAIDYEPSHPRRQYCWLLSSTVTGPASGVTHYVIRTCSGIFFLNAHLFCMYNMAYLLFCFIIQAVHDITSVVR